MRQGSSQVKLTSSMGFEIETKKTFLTIHFKQKIVNHLEISQFQNNELQNIVVRAIFYITYQSTSLYILNCRTIYISNNYLSINRVRQKNYSISWLRIFQSTPNHSRTILERIRTEVLNILKLSRTFQNFQNISGILEQSRTSRTF